MIKFGKIVKIISEYEVIINLGEIDGIMVGDEIIVYVEGPSVTDDEGNSYGTLDFTKDIIQVKTVYDSLAICNMTKVVKGSLGISSMMVDTARGLSETLYGSDKREAVKINVEKTEIDNALYEEFTKQTSSVTKKIKVGDLVKFIQE